MAFRGLGADALPFLTALGFHQTKEWFEANREIYETALKEPLGDFVEDLAGKLAKAKIPLTGDRRSSLFRIHRDVRFAKDKSPYKTNVAAALSRSGSKNDPGLLYLHVSPTEGCFAAAGFYRPAPEQLTRLRRAVEREPTSFRRMTNALKKTELKLSGEDAAKRASAEFASLTDPELLNAVRLKSFFCLRMLPEGRIHEPRLVDDMLDFAKDASPLLRWGWSALADER